VSKNQLEVMPAYWWMYNMFALARNSWKFQNRDKRIHKDQNIEFDPFAPDTIGEIFNTRTLIEIWTAKADLRLKGQSLEDRPEEELTAIGREILSRTEKDTGTLEVLGENMENTRRKQVILKPYKAYHAYGDILHYYAVKNLFAYLNSDRKLKLSKMFSDLKGTRHKDWVNLGGQLMQREDLDKLRSDIGSGKLGSWKKIHDRYNELWVKYQTDKQKHAFATLGELYGIGNPGTKDWISFVDKAVSIQNFISEQVYDSRKKDFDNPFKMTTFRNQDEKNAGLGNLDENSFILQIRKETEEFKLLAEEMKKR
jgi:hypothetical protein